MLNCCKSVVKHMLDRTVLFVIYTLISRIIFETPNFSYILHFEMILSLIIINGIANFTYNTFVIIPND